MELATGAMGSLIPKLKELLKEEYKLQTGVKNKVRSLVLELERAHAALREVAKVPPDPLDEFVKIWARELREASYDMEDMLDFYLLRFKGSSKANDQDSFLKHLGEIMAGLFKKSMEHHKIVGGIEKTKKNLQEVTERLGRFTVDSIVAKPTASRQTGDPQFTAMYREASQIIGIDKSSADLVSMLLPKGDDESNQKMKIVSIVGVGGLGKTTLAKAVYDKFKSMFDYGAFVLVGQDPDVNKVLRDILIDLDKEKYTDLKYTTLDERQLINELHDFLRGKRYFIIIDNIWEPQTWERIKVALVENNLGSIIITTTRKFEVAKEADEVYKLQPLSDDNSKRLFYMRLFGHEDKCPNNYPNDLSNAILKKCGGVPLAIIMMASLLLGKSREEWIEVCNSPGFYRDKDERHMENTMDILSLSYYHLPSHLKTCLLYLSVFPEDYLIDKDSLIWKWIAEGFVERKPERGLFEVGEEYFHDLINRSMIQEVDSQVYGIIKYCRVHDMVRDLIISISTEENFVSANGTLSQTHTRRLALKNRELDLTRDTHVNLPQVRSFIVWGCDIDKWALHPRLKLTRVLALERCTFREGCHSQRQFVKDLGNLCELRVLKIDNTSNMDESMQIDLMQSLGNLLKMQHLTLDDSIGTVNMNAWDAAAPSRDIRCLLLPYIEFPRLPSWINSAHLPSLSHLDIHVNGMDEQGFMALGGLPMLCYLRLFSRAAITSNIEADGCFQKLRSWVLPHLMVQFVANKDSSTSITIFGPILSSGMPIGRSRKQKDDCDRVVAAVVFMPELEELEFSVSVEKLMENNISCEDLGLEYLPSIRKVKVDFWCGNAFVDDVEREEAALRHAIQIHPNRPILQIQYIGKIFLKSYDGMQPTGTSGTGHDQMRMNTPPLMQTCDEEWILDTSAVEHCTSDQRLLPKNSRDDHIGWIGSVETERFKVLHVRYIPGAEMKNIISVSKLAVDHGLEVVFEPACCYVRDPVTGKDIGLGQQRNGAYVLHSLLIGNSQDVLPSGLGAQELRDYGRSPRKLKWPDYASWFGRITRFGRAGYPTEDIFTGSSPHDEQRVTRTAEFYIDSGVCHHMTWNGDVLKPYHDSVQIKPPIESVTIGAEKNQSAVIMDQLPRPLKVAGIGYIDSTGGLLDRVLLVPDSDVNLVSVNQLTVDYSVRVVFHQDEFWIEKLESNERFGKGKRVGSNYVVAVLDPCDWVLDSFTWVHHTANRKILYNFQETAEHPQILGNGLVRTERFNVPGVRYIAGDARNVISVAQLADDHGLVTIFEPEFCYIKEKETGEIVGQGYLRDGVYVLNSLRLNQDKTEQGAGEGPGRRDSGASERDRGQGGSGRDGGSTEGEDGKRGRGQGQAASGGSGGGSGGEKEDNEDKKVERAEEEQEDEEEEEEKVDKEEAEEVVNEEREGGDEGNDERENETVGDLPQESYQSEPPLFDSSPNVGRVYFSCGLPSDKDRCIVDSGATHHLTPHKDLLLLGSFYMSKENRKFPKNKVQAVLVAESKSLLVEGFRNLKKDAIKIDDVLYVPKHAANLISVSQLLSQLSQQLEEHLQMSEVARQLEAMDVPRLRINLVAHHLEDMGMPKECVEEFTSQVRCIGVTQELIGSLNNALQGMGLSQDGINRLLVSELQPSGVHYDHQIWEIAKPLENMSVPQLEVDELAGQLEASCVQDILWIHKLGTHLLALNFMLNNLAPQLHALCVSLTPHRIKEFADQHEALRNPQLQFDRLAPLLQAMCVPWCWIQQLENQLQALGVPQLRVDELASQLEATRVPQGFIDELTTHLGDMSMPQDVIKKVATELKDMGASQLRPDDLVDYLQTLGMQLQIEDVATSLRAHGVRLLQTNELAHELQAVGAPWLLIDEVVRQIDAVGVVEQQRRVDELVANLRQPAGMDVQQHRLDYLAGQLSIMGVPPILTRQLQTVGRSWSWIQEIVRQLDAVGVMEQQHRVNKLVVNLRAMNLDPWRLQQQFGLQPGGMDVPQHLVDHLVCRLRDMGPQLWVEELARLLSGLGVPQLLTSLLDPVGTPWSWIKEIASLIKPVVPLSVGDFDITVGNLKVGNGTKPRGGLYHIKELGPCPPVQLSVKREEATMSRQRQDRTSRKPGEWVLTEIP